MRRIEILRHAPPPEGLFSFRFGSRLHSSAEHIFRSPAAVYGGTFFDFIVSSCRRLLLGWIFCPSWRSCPPTDRPRLLRFVTPSLPSFALIPSYFGYVVPCTRAFVWNVMKMVFRKGGCGGIIHRSIDHRQNDSRCYEVEEFGERGPSDRPTDKPFTLSLSLSLSPSLSFSLKCF